MDKLDRLPNAEDVKIKKKFEQRYRELLGERYDEFMRYSLSYINKSIRVNTIKISVSELRDRLVDDWNLVPIPWCPEGFWIEDREEERYDIGNLVEHQLGYVYVQEAASMIPPQVLKPGEGELVLDMAAAPGSKTTQLSAMMKNTGAIVANDVSVHRLKSLGINVQRCGNYNVVMTKMMGHEFKHRNNRFDKVLVDAPCSGTGTVRTSLKTLKMWSPNIIKKLQGTQKQLIDSGFCSLKSGGSMVYSTCTQEPEENEEVVSWLLEKYDDAELDEIKLDINRSPAITEFNGKDYLPDVKKCLRIYPQDNNTEGFFIARISKK